MILYIIRHGDPDYQNDCLTETGKIQAQKLADYLKDTEVSAIYSSPMGRARQTAQPVCEIKNLPCNIENWAHEIYFKAKTDDEGEIFGTAPRGGLMKSDEMLCLKDRWYEHRFYQDSGAKEGYDEIVSGADDFLLRLGYKREGKRYKIIQPNENSYFLFCHGGLGLTLLAHLLAIDIPVMWSSFDLDLTSVTKLVFKNYPDGYTAPRCKYFNNTEHLLF